MEEEATVNVWNKNASDVTVGENLGIAIAAAVIATVVGTVVLRGIAGVGYLVEMRKTKKAAQLALVNNEVAS